MWTNNRQESSGNGRCSFCGKGRDQIGQLIAGPGDTYICNECVDLYREHLETMTGASPTMESMRKVCGVCGTCVPASHHYCHNCGSPFAQER